MNIHLKKALYESIMKNVAKQIKKTLNEDFIAADLRKDVSDFDDVIVPVLKTRLKKGIVEFEFIKADGTSRSAKGTLNPGIISQFSMDSPESDDTKLKQARTAPTTLVRYFDVEKADWRSCKSERIVKILDSNIDPDMI